MAFVVHRYHPEIAGGAERHCREMARHMARHWDVTVLTSCARDYPTWADAYPPGESADGEVKLRRFPVSVQRDYPAFDALSIPVLAGGAGAEMEQRWIEAQGPVLPGLVDFLRREGAGYEAFVFFTYLYWTTVRGLVEGYATSLNRWPQVVATGGDLTFIAPHWDYLDTLVPHLTLQGIGLAYQKYLTAKGV